MDAQDAAVGIPDEREIEQAQLTLQQMASMGAFQGGSPAGLISSPAPGAVQAEHAHAPPVWEAAARYRALVEKIPAVTFMAALDENLHELYISPQIQNLLGYSQEEWLGDPFLWYTRLHPDDRERWQREFALTCTSGVHFRSEYRFLARDGRVVWVHGECQVIRDDEGRPLFLQGIAFDITESKRAEEALQEMQRGLEVKVRERTAELADANASLREEIAKRMELEETLQQRAEQLADQGRRKDHFLAVLAHELRNPLATITTALQLLRREGRLAADQRLWAEGMMEQQVRHLTRLVDDLLDISRITLGKIELRKETADLAAVVTRACEATRPFLRERRHELSVSITPEPITVEADVTRLEQVLVNLMTNAAKFTEPGGHISVSAVRESGEAVLRVRDTGVGIPPEMLEHIFELFTQVDTSVSRTSQWGMGIGLALVRGLVELHGGRIQAFSAGAGHGSEFTVRLPLSHALVASEAGTPTPAPAARSGARRRILVVEDRPEFAKTLALLLRMWGHDVRVAGNGPEALEAVHAAPPEVVLLDIGLPGMDGYQVAQELRRQPGFTKMLLVALTGYGRAEDRERSAEAGFDHHLTKPVTAEALQEVLAHCED